MNTDRFGWRHFGWPALCCAISVLTISASGARFQQNFLDGRPPVSQDADLWPWPWLMANPHLLRNGLGFTATLLGILLIHEFAHLLACRWHGIRASLPWVLPAPTLSGTFGAVIRLRSSIPHRAAQMHIGLSGPLAGYLASCMAITAGLLLSRNAAPLPHDAPWIFGVPPLTVQILHQFLRCFIPALPTFGQVVPHPVLIAGWIGLLVTALNLLPAGQLDGGHLLAAISPSLHRRSSRWVPWLLIATGLFFWLGWILWGLLLLVPALRQPRSTIASERPQRRAAAGLIGLSLFLLSFTWTPFAGSSLLQLIR